MVPSPSARPSGRDDAAGPTALGADADRVEGAIAAALAVLDGRTVADPDAGPPRRVVTVLDAILAARTAVR